MNQNGIVNRGEKGDLLLWMLGSRLFYFVFSTILIHALNYALKSEISNEERIAVRKRRQYDIQLFTARKKQEVTENCSKEIRITNAIGRVYQNTKGEGAKVVPQNWKILCWIGRST